MSRKFQESSTVSNENTSQISRAAVAITDFRLVVSRRHLPASRKAELNQPATYAHDSVMIILCPTRVIFTVGEIESALKIYCTTVGNITDCLVNILFKMIIYL